jgi:hypothetical protein
VDQAARQPEVVARLLFSMSETRTDLEVEPTLDVNSSLITERNGYYH